MKWQQSAERRRPSATTAVAAPHPAGLLVLGVLAVVVILRPYLRPAATVSSVRSPPRCTAGGGRGDEGVAPEGDDACIQARDRTGEGHRLRLLHPARQGSAAERPRSPRPNAPGAWPRRLQQDGTAGRWQTDAHRRPPVDTRPPNAVTLRRTGGQSADGKTAGDADADAGYGTRQRPRRQHRYLLQAGAFQASGQAEELKAKIALLGLGARVESAEISGKTVYRVRMGPYGTAGDLAEAKRKLSAGGMQALAIKVK
jgi:cell division septation protein DedD